MAVKSGDLSVWLRCRAHDRRNEYTGAEQDYLNAAAEVQRMREALDEIAARHGEGSIEGDIARRGLALGRDPSGRAAA